MPAPTASQGPSTAETSSSGEASTSRTNAVTSSSKARTNAAASSSSSWRTNAVASSSSSGHRNAEASSSEYRALQHRDLLGDSSPYMSSPAIDPSVPWSLGPLPPLPSMGPPLIPLPNIYERMDKERQEEEEGFTKIPTQLGKSKSRRRGKQEFAYTETDVLALIQGLSSDDDVVFDWAMNGLQSIMDQQSELLLNAVLPYLPSILALIPATSSSEARCLALLDYVAQFAAESQEPFDVLEKNLDLEGMLKLLRKSPSVKIRLIILRLLNSMMGTCAERDESDHSGDEGDRDNEDQDHDKGRPEGNELESSVNGFLSNLEKRVIAALRSTRFFQFDTLEDDSAGNGKGKARASQTVKWNTDDAFSAIAMFRFAISNRWIPFCMASLEAGALDFLLLVATTPNSDSPRSPPLTRARVAAVTCVGELYLIVVERVLSAFDFPYECSVDDEDAQLDLQGRMLMPLLGLIDDTDTAVSDEVVEVLCSRFDDVDEAVQIFLWSSDGCVEKLVHKYALVGVKVRETHREGDGRHGQDDVGQSAMNDVRSGNHPQADQGKEEARVGLFANIPADLGWGGSLPDVGHDVGDTGPLGSAELLRKRLKLDLVPRYPRSQESRDPMDEGVDGKGKRIVGRPSAQGETLDTILSDMSARSAALIDMGTAAEKIAIGTSDKGKGRAIPEVSLVEGKKRSYSDMLGVTEGGGCSGSCPHCAQPHSYVPPDRLRVRVLELLLEKLIERNSDGVTEAFRALWDRKDVEDETKMSLLYMLSNPLSPMAVKTVAMSAGLPVHVEMAGKAGGMVLH